MYSGVSGPVGPNPHLAILVVVVVIEDSVLVAARVMARHFMCKNLLCLCIPCYMLSGVRCHEAASSVVSDGIR